jgi:probable rRNA maturation factor
MAHPIQFFSEEIDFSLKKSAELSLWISGIASQFGAEIEGLSYIFCSDDYLLSLNQQYLGHDYYTDILTFPYSPAGSPKLLSDIYISVDRVQENAQSLQTAFEDELHRVMIHGVLHLLGYEDHGLENEQKMRQLEEEALAKRNF